ncbi:MAG: hypothetical protein WD077_13415 [Bacteroidia bacterium]
MKNLATILVATFAFLLLAMQCRKKDEPKPNSEPGLPPITTSGENTFGMKVNGELWLPNKLPGHPTTGPKAIYKSGELSISANRYYEPDYDSSENLNIGFVSGSRLVEDTGTFRLITYPFGGGAYRTYYPSVICHYETDSSSIGELHISRLDKDIVSGTFWMTVVPKKGECADTIYITDGRFDFKYY